MAQFANPLNNVICGNSGLLPTVAWLGLGLGLASEYRSLEQCWQQDSEIGSLLSKKEEKVELLGRAARILRGGVQGTSGYGTSG